MSAQKIMSHECQATVKIGMAKLSIIEQHTLNTFEQDSDLLALYLFNSSSPTSFKVINITSRELQFTDTESYGKFHPRSGLLNCC